MTARLSIHVPDEAVHVRALGEDTEFLFGRDARCAIVVDHHSISRRHLRLCRNKEGAWSIEDLGSKNGTRIDGRPLTGPSPIASGHWFAAGDIYAHFEITDATTEESRRSDDARRRHTSMIWNSRLRHGNQAQRLITDLLRGVVDVAEARRGFLLSAGADGQWRVRACYGIDPDEMASRAFSGSRSAVDRAIEAGRPVYLSDQRDRAWLQQQASVIDSGIRALVAIPLLRDDRVLGVVYADTDDQERIYTDLDAQLLDALVEQAGNVVGALELEAGLAAISALFQVVDHGTSAEIGPAPSWTGAAGSNLQRESR